MFGFKRRKNLEAMLADITATADAVAKGFADLAPVGGVRPDQLVAIEHFVLARLRDEVWSKLSPAEIDFVWPPIEKFARKALRNRLHAAMPASDLVTEGRA